MRMPVRSDGHLELNLGRVLTHVGSLAQAEREQVGQRLPPKSSQLHCAEGEAEPGALGFVAEHDVAQAYLQVTEECINKCAHLPPSGGQRLFGATLTVCSTIGFCTGQESPPLELLAEPAPQPLRPLLLEGTKDHPRAIELYHERRVRRLAPRQKNFKPVDVDGSHGKRQCQRCQHPRR